VKGCAKSRLGILSQVRHSNASASTDSSAEITIDTDALIMGKKS
jgi:hypothetical protein